MIGIYILNFFRICAFLLTMFPLFSGTGRAQQDDFSFLRLDGSSAGAPKTYWAENIAIVSTYHVGWESRIQAYKDMMIRVENKAWQLAVVSNPKTYFKNRKITDDVNFGFSIVNENILNNENRTEAFVNRFHETGELGVIERIFLSPRTHIEITHPRYENQCGAYVDAAPGNVFETEEIHGAFIYASEALNILELEKCFTDMIFRLFGLNFLDYPRIHPNNDQFDSSIVYPIYPLFLVAASKCREISNTDYDTCWHKEVSQMGAVGALFFDF